MDGVILGKSLGSADNDGNNVGVMDGGDETDGFGDVDGVSLGAALILGCTVGSCDGSVLGRTETLGGLEGKMDGKMDGESLG
jgi:hypothetical protein